MMDCDRIDVFVFTWVPMNFWMILVLLLSFSNVVADFDETQNGWRSLEEWYFE